MAVFESLAGWISQKTGRSITADVLRAWWAAARPAYYIATLIPLFVGFTAAGKDGGLWRGGLFLVILLGCFLLHLAANLSNDYYDFLSGVDNDQTIGGSRMIQGGSISLKQYRLALCGLYGVTLLLALVGFLWTGLAGIWGIILFAMFAAHFYVAPPIRFGYRAMGEVLVFLSMGVTMTAGTYYVLTGVLSLKMLAVSVPIGLMVAGILYFQSMPEIETDKAAGKRTLANTLGPDRAVKVFLAWWPTVWALLLLLYFFGACGWQVMLGIAVSLPLHFIAFKHVKAAQTSGEWLPLDAHGKYVRMMYLFCGLSLIAAIALQKG